jgi:hypothetical protein
MANAAVYRDQSKLNYLPAFNDTTVGRIDKISLAVAAIVGLFGILYFSLAPAAMSTEVVIGSEQLSGYKCKMIASITRETPMFSTPGLQGNIPSQESIAKVSDFNSQTLALAVSIGLSLFIPNNNPSFAVDWPWMYPDPHGRLGGNGHLLKYDNVLLDTYDGCLAAVRAKPITCTLKSNGPNYNGKQCELELFSSTALGLLRDARIAGLSVNQTVLSDPAVGRCNNQVNVSACLNIANCASLERFRAGLEDKLRTIIFTPEALCQPFVKNPPYICTKSLPPSVPSILSQALAFFTSALAAAKTALFFSTEMRHKCHNKAPNKDDGGPGTNGDVKAQKGASKPSDISVEMRSFQEEPFDKGSSSRFERIETQMHRFEARFKIFETEQAEILDILQDLRNTINGRAIQEVAASDAYVSQAPHRTTTQARVISALAPDRSRPKLLAPRASAQQGGHAGNPPNVSLPDVLEILQTPPRRQLGSRGRYAGKDGSRDA